ncbi:MAG: VOC family protein [Actinomycetia bacterium]|nr:VOC family protein [Actinomycetes bacterium]
MDVRWLTVFIDQPADRFEASTAFWRAVTESDRSPARGDRDQFATLVPPTGDPYVRVQQTFDESRIHIDLHVPSIPHARQEAEALGATVLAEPGHLIMASPNGLVFCLVGHHGESTAPTPIGGDTPYSVDQVCIDVQADRFESEAAFWAELTGWERNVGALDEFHWLARPAGLPVRVLLQRLGADDTGGPVRAHLDVACGAHGSEIATQHERLGATRGSEGRFWIAMTDPAGLPYCLTQRDPVTGGL